ncbi:unnamed protein product [Prunus armeniaca]|uniref:Cytochrome c oxidase subunit 5C n=1 Tax=Prunus armeniaca TaxID=36596 RepID=A0A6J5TH68_PRUAR|nr:unnamed protein product [Prunus armeniaca]CAB4293999.1 unnamed protein product [Prunus armeniaca]
MAGRVAHPTLKGPSVIREICFGIVIAFAAGGFWKMYHWDLQKKTRSLYELLEKDEVSVVPDE